MKSEINTYHVLVQSIKSLDKRKDVKGKDTFSLPEWWRCNSGNLPHFAFVLRALLTKLKMGTPWVGRCTGMQGVGRASARGRHTCLEEGCPRHARVGLLNIKTNKKTNGQTYFIVK